MEINGIANIKILVDRAVRENTESHTSIDIELADKINNQLDLLNRYMIAYAEHNRSAIAFQNFSLAPEVDHMVEEPKWHEVRENPEKYPTLTEKVNKDLK